MAFNVTPVARSDAASSSPSYPFDRASSPSPSASPTPALLACPELDRSFSTASSISTFSGRSSASRSSSGSGVGRRRGYVRPQGVEFSESAKNRDSVMSLGSIAHLQYYFARTGMLDGKGGQLAKDPKQTSMNTKSSTASSSEDREFPSFTPIVEEMVNSPVDELDLSGEWDDPIMLPPTVSTYSHRSHYVPPPPDAETMRKDLNEGLFHVTQAIQEVQNQAKENVNQKEDEVDAQSNDEDSVIMSPSQGWHEIQGLHMLDVVTLAIRSAKTYYTTHEQPQRLAIIKSERQVREELLGVLDVLKRMATRNFEGGIKEGELQVIKNWVGNVEDFLAREKGIEEQEAQDRQSWQWLEGDWIDGQRRREWLFLSTFTGNDELPEWSSESQHLPTPFLEALRNGLTLVRLHNTILKKTKRHFGEIKTFHSDTAKPYRCAENLRYWIKAAEIRWEIKLQVDVMGVVYGKGDEAWKEFDAAIFRWCKAVREEITKEWKQGSVQVPSPTLEV